VLSKKERRQLTAILGERYGLNIDKEAKIEKMIEDDIELIIIDGIAAFIKLGEDYVPHLRILLRRPDTVNIPKIIVDQGAVAPIARGADVMRPGILGFEGDFSANQIVAVVEPSRKLPIAVHRSLYSRAEIEAMKRGRVTKRLHYLGDRYWKLAEALGI
jgi:PUA domain protein